jgi:NAD(P)-dependent dehydrogenase (short-subunit alcohol dehydrogenase family)
MGLLDGRVAIVTGGSKGMGRHFVQALVKAGAKVACLARPSVELDAVRAELGDAVLALPCDVSSSMQVNAAVEAAVATFGKLDILVNNAAIFHPFLIEKATDSQIRQHIGLNIEGVMWLSRAAIPHLRKTQGQIVSISSESVRHPFPMLSVYAATKAAIEVFSQALRDELRSDNIRVSILRSGSVAGGTGGATWPEGIAEVFYKKILETGHAHMAGEAASPDSMAKALLAVLTLPADISPDLIEVRAARSGIPEGAKSL